MPEHHAKDPRSWTPEERRSIILSILRGEISLEEAAGRYGLTVEHVEDWRDEFLAAAEDALRPGTEKDTVPVEDYEHHLGVWVCAAGTHSLAPYLFVQAASPGGPPQPAAARWQGTGSPPKPFRQKGELNLLQGQHALRTGGRVLFDLYTARIPDVETIEHRSALADWRFPVEIGGVILLLTEPLDIRGERRLFGAVPVRGDRALAWTKRQALPVAAAAMGRRAGEFSEEVVRRRCRLPAGVPIVPGPALARVQESKPGLSGLARGGDSLIRFLLGNWGGMQFDADYAVRLLHALAGRTLPER